MENKLTNESKFDTVINKEIFGIELDVLFFISTGLFFAYKFYDCRKAK
jgi:hypothetical protein